MARKKKHPEHVNHERWLVSYADFMTLLFAFFVVMFASSQVDTQKVGRFTESFSKAVGIEVFPESGKSLLGGNSAKDAVTVAGKGDMSLPIELQELRTLIEQKAKKDELGAVQLLIRRNEIVLRLADNVVFASGTDEIQPAARSVLAHIADDLKTRNVDVRVEGHTDDRPIKTFRFRSNWDLSTSRATAVVADFANAGIDPVRLSAAGYGEFHPIATNASPEGRAQNRRVDVVVSARAVDATAAKSDAGADEKSDEKSEDKADTIEKDVKDGGLLGDHEARSPEGRSGLLGDHEARSPEGRSGLLGDHEARSPEGRSGSNAPQKAEKQARNDVLPSAETKNEEKP